MYDLVFSPLSCGPNDGGIQRGDSAASGDVTVRPKSTVGVAGSPPTPNPDGENLDDAEPSSPEIGGVEAEPDSEELTVHTADDPDLGLTNIGQVPPDDWAANTGPDRDVETDSVRADILRGKHGGI
ncbi:MAG TPA: hypothetical protein VM120_23730 [Bryobacteraceae bacterium]|nr:hypothetical protein [Bryobacteraceae bacterium]